METNKFYVIDGVTVSNIIVCTNDYALQNNLIKHPVVTEFGTADINWTYIDRKFLPPPRNILYEWEVVRQKRNMLLSQSDTWLFADIFSSFTPDQQQQISEYRKKLRDIPQSFVDPKEVVFPNKPDFV